MQESRISSDQQFRQHQQLQQPPPPWHSGPFGHQPQWPHAQPPWYPGRPTTSAAAGTEPTNNAAAGTELPDRPPPAAEPPQPWGTYGVSPNAYAASGPGGMYAGHTPGPSYGPPMHPWGTYGGSV